MDKGIGLYVHVPFCKSKCYYCDFNSYSGMEHLAGSYFNALKTEMGIVSQALRNCPVRTVFIGGGTPSLVDPGYIRGLLEDCAMCFSIAPDAEITMESNPGTLSFENLRIYRQAGVNRLSIGLQAWQDRLLESLGRIHKRKQFIDNIEAAYEAGFSNINADLIFSLPGQSFEEWAETLEAVTSPFSGKRLTHLSCYSLQIEEGTVFGERYESGTLDQTDDELDRKMYRHAVEFLADRGYGHYEISNFALPGFECRHNLVYWKAEEYAGFGAGAHSYLGGKRFCNPTEIEQYIDAVKRFGDRVRRSGDTVKGGAPGGSDNAGCDCKGDNSSVAGLTDAGAEAGLFEDIQEIGRRESMAEYMILGLRLTKGVTSAEFSQRYGTELEEVYADKLDKLVREGLLIREEAGCSNLSDDKKETKEPSFRFAARYRLSRLGLDLANKVFVEFI